MWQQHESNMKLIRIVFKMSHRQILTRLFLGHSLKLSKTFREYHPRCFIHGHGHPILTFNPIAKKLTDIYYGKFGLTSFFVAI